MEVVSKVQMVLYVVLYLQIHFLVTNIMEGNLHIKLMVISDQVEILLMVMDVGEVVVGMEEDLVVAISMQEVVYLDLYSIQQIMKLD